MATNVQISCINKQDRQNPWERITHIGGMNADNSRWKLTQQAAVEGIDAGKWKFWVEVPKGDSVWVVIAVSRFGNKYLKTEPDGDQPNNLLAECP